MNDYYVYVLFRPNGLPCYVGKGKGRRWRLHERRCHNPHLARIIRNANGDLPKIKIRESLTESEAFEIEKAFIGAIGRSDIGGPLVNLTDVGEGISGHRHSEETRQKLRGPKRPETLALQSAIQKAIWQRRSPDEKKVLHARSGAALFGKPLSDQHRQSIGRGLIESPLNNLRAKKIGDALRGRKRSPEHCRAISEAKIGKNTGPRPSEWKLAISRGQAARWQRRKADMQGATS